MDDLQQLINRAKTDKLILITTQKDAVKLKALPNFKPRSVVVMPINVQWADPLGVQDFIMTQVDAA